MKANLGGVFPSISNPRCIGPRQAAPNGANTRNKEPHGSFFIIKKRKEKNKMDYTLKAREIVRDYVNEHLDKTDGIAINMTDTYVVWQCKTLQNWKALVSTTLPDGMYYEVTYNGDKNEVYLDTYKKFENRCIKL
nr:MAG TPA: hypothetical protein [Caudoviricetes sp.]